MKESLLKVKLPSPKDPSMGVSKTVYRKSPMKMEMVHLNKREVANLDKAQGGVVMKDGMRDYTKLGHVFNNPEFLDRFHKLGRSFHAKGGVTKLREMKKHGRYGDTEIANMPSHVANHLDRLIGGTCRNPKSGKREYFFGALASGLANLASRAAPYAAKAASSIGNMAMKAAPYVGKAANFALNAAPSIMAIKQANDAAKNQPPQMDENGQPITMQNAGMNAGINALIGGLQTKAQGGSWQDALKSGAGAGANNFMNSQYVQNAQNNYDPNAGGPSRFSQMSQQYAPLINAGKSAYNAYQGGQSIGNSLGQGAYTGAMQGLDRYGGQNARSAQNMLQSGYQGYQQGGMQGAMRGAGRSGMEEGLGRMGGNSGNAARSAYQSYQDTGDMGQAALRGAGSYARGRGYQDLGEGLDYASQARGMGGGYGDMAGMGALGALQSYQSRRMPQSRYQNQYDEEPMDEGYGYGY